MEGQRTESIEREDLLSTKFDHLIEKWDPSKDPVYVPPTLVPREKWGAVPPKYREPLCTPVGKVLILDTKSDFCTCEETCSIVLKELQKHYMEEKGMPDIPWNFMIGEDGRVYEGRGWVTNPSKTLPETEQHHGATLDIAYIGKYHVKMPSEIMTERLDDLISIGQGKTVIDMVPDLKSELMSEFDEDEWMKNKQQ